MSDADNPTYEGDDSSSEDFNPLRAAWFALLTVVAGVAAWGTGTNPAEPWPARLVVAIVCAVVAGLCAVGLLAECLSWRHGQHNPRSPSPGNSPDVDR